MGKKKATNSAPNSPVVADREKQEEITRDKYERSSSPKSFAASSQPVKKVAVTKSKVLQPKGKKIITEADFHTKHEHYMKDHLIKGFIIALSIWVVSQVPIPQNDVQKSASSSFLSLFLAGKLDSIHHINQIVMAGIASVFFDTAVVYYHLTNPPHPKFVMVLPRKISIYTHLISGIVEIVSGVAVFVLQDQTIQQQLTKVMAVASITHALTAYYQTGVVFGAKGIMVPGYLYAVTIHITNAIRLFNKPTSFLFYYGTFLTLHIYVWCRFFVFFFRMCGAFNGYHYTVAITLSGALLFPFSMGPLGNYTFLFICTVYCILEAILSDKKGKDLVHKLFAEHERYALVTTDSVNTWKASLAADASANISADEKMARGVFDKYDTDKSGKLGVNEINTMVKSLGVSAVTATKILESADVNNNGSVEFDEFYRFVWNAGAAKDRLVKPAGKDVPSSERDQAKLVFDMLDIDQSGYIDVAELQMLLTQWGMPEDEAEKYLSKYVVNKRQITLDTFHKNLKPIWSFGVTQCFNA